MEEELRMNIEYAERTCRYAGPTRQRAKTLKLKLETYLFIFKSCGLNHNQPLESHFIRLPLFSFESVILEHIRVLLAILELIQEEEASEQAWCGIGLHESASSSP